MHGMPSASTVTSRPCLVVCLALVVEAETATAQWRTMVSPWWTCCHCATTTTLKAFELRCLFFSFSSYAFYDACVASWALLLLRNLE
jgi:hypothetical protein